MVTFSQGDGVSSLPTEMWISILAYAKEPAVSSVCKLFHAIYSDPTVIWETILPDLKMRGIELEFIGETSNITKLEKVKSAIADRLFGIVSPSFYGKCMQASSLSLATFIRIFREEEAVSLNKVFERIAPVLFSSLKSDPDVFTKGLPAASLERAETIRTFLTNNRDMVSAIDTLDLKGLKLTLVPDELRLFTSLKKIDLSDNKLTKLSPSFGEAWGCLTECRLDFNNMKSLPEGFGKNWTYLSQFTMVHNKLMSLPEDFGEGWSDLVSVDLNFNQLTRLPEKFGKGWSKCKSISIDSNKLVSIPDSIARYCPELQFLRAKKNPLDPLAINHAAALLPNLLALV